MPSSLNMARSLALLGSAQRVIRGFSTLAQCQAELTANFDAAAATELATITAGIVQTAPSLVPQTGKTAVVSLKATGTTAIDLPVDATRLGLVVFSAFVVTARSGTNAAGTLTYKVGTNAAHDNIIQSTSVGAAAFNGPTFALPFSLAGPASGGLVAMDSQPVLEITSALTTVTTLAGRFGMQMLYV